MNIVRNVLKKVFGLEMFSVHLRNARRRRLIENVLVKRNFSSIRIVPESPRWVLLHSASGDATSEAKGLLERAVTEEERRSSQYQDCLALWGKFYSPPETGHERRCFSFLRLKEPRRTTIVLGFAW